MIRQIGAVLVALVLLGSGASAQTSPIDAARFVDPVSAWSGTISPDGNHVAYIARTDAGQEIVVVDVANQSARAIQAIPTAVGAFDWIRWKSNERLILGASVERTIAGQTRVGTLLRDDDSSYRMSRVLALNRDGSGVVQMFEGRMRTLLRGGGSTFLADRLANDPNHVLLTAWDNSGTGVWRADITTGRVERVVEGSQATWYYVTDGNGAPVIRVDWLSDDSGYRIYRRAPGAPDWTFLREARRAATATNSPDFQIVGPGPGAGVVYVLSRADNADLLSLFLLNTATGEMSVPTQAGAQIDTAAAWISPRTRELLATCEFAQRYRCRALDQSVQRNLNALERFFEHHATIKLVETSEDAGRWLLRVDGPMMPAAYYIYDTTAHSVVPIASVFPGVVADALSPTEVVNYQARDGAPLWAYVTARPGANGPRPMVVLPHGGPESRDHYEYDSFVQLLASRGYVVVQPNFRGSVGFGRAFADAGRGQWGLRMQDDVTDAANHMIQTGVADPHRVCIVGASYGGYAALQGAVSTPELYRCAVSVAGVSDLLEMLRVERSDGRNSSNYHYWLRSIGDPDRNRAALEAVSPRRNAARVSSAVLLIHGEEDDVVPIRQSEIMEAALRAAGKPVRLIRVPEEGHGWDEWSREHRHTLYREVDAFLAQHLGE